MPRIVYNKDTGINEVFLKDNQPDTIDNYYWDLWLKNDSVLLNDRMEIMSVKDRDLSKKDIVHMIISKRGVRYVSW